MKKLEIILAILVLTGFIMIIFHIIPGGTIASLSILSLAILYYVLSFALFNNIRMKDIFNKEAYKDTNALRIIGGIVTGIGISSLLVGTLFKVQRWPMADTGFFSGLIITLIVSAVAIYKFSRTQAAYYKAILIRTFLIMGFGSFFYLVSFIMRLAN